METTALDPRVSVFGSAAEEAAYNVWLSAELEKRAQDTRPGIPHDEVGANLAALLNQLQKKAA
ncbi:MAG: antitoxin [Rhodoferax sp.]